MALEKIGHLGGFEVINLFASEANRTELPFLLRSGATAGPTSCIAINAYNFRQAGIFLETVYPEVAEFAELEQYANLDGNVSVECYGNYPQKPLREMAWADVGFGSASILSKTREWLNALAVTEDIVTGSVTVEDVAFSGLGSESAKTGIFIPRASLMESGVPGEGERSKMQTLIIAAICELSEGYELQISGIYAI